MNQPRKRTINVGVACLVTIALLYANSVYATEYYEEPAATAPHAKLAYMAEKAHVLVVAIDGKAVFGDKTPQRLMCLEGATSDKYLRITPGTHELRLRVFYQEGFGGAREMSDVSAVDVQFDAGHTYYPLAQKTPSGGGKVKAVFWIASAETSGDLKPTTEFTEPEGFLGVEWGSPTKAFPKLKNVRTEDAGTLVYNPTSSDVGLGLAKADKVEFGFWKQRFSDVLVQTKGYEDWLRLREAVFQRFGPAEGMGLSGKDKELVAILYLWGEETGWDSGKSKMMLSYSPSTTTANLNIFSAAVEKQRNPQQPNAFPIQTSTVALKRSQAPVVRPAVSPSTPKSKSDVATALLPPYSNKLSGMNPVRIKNPNGFNVVAGIRSGQSGVDLSVAAEGMSTTYVPDGNYKVFFVYSNRPDALFQGDDFVLNGNGVEIQIVKIVGGNYRIRQVK